MGKVERHPLVPEQGNTGQGSGLQEKPRVSVPEPGQFGLGSWVPSREVIEISRVVAETDLSTMSYG